jgi:nitrite transporter NirC
MYTDTLDHFAAIAVSKSKVLKKNPLSFFIGSMMAGAYVGLGIILIFSIGAYVDPSIRKLVMGGTFGIALTLVVFAGSELFTGLTMFMTMGWLRKLTGPKELIGVWTVSWIGNLAGAVGLALVFALGGGGDLFGGGADLLNGVAGAKMGKPALELFALGILCNWLVCLALWMAARTKNDAAKCIVIFWCLLAFIASGYEHSVANMTVFSIALLGNHPESVSLAGMAHNLVWVTLGNAVAGALFMGVGYWRASPQASTPKSEPVPGGVDETAEGTAELTA